MEARPLEGLKLWLRFSDGKEGVVDLSALELPVRALDGAPPKWAVDYPRPALDAQGHV
ncbi:DUF2442 domain-containing protein [Thermus thermophilus]|uniref:DUF2442 domain-containing protein n=1 Tax=Thermus thermophilus TaxID=274 RepID=UPI0002F9B4BC|nr:DUF2442 domain-containing protein [Thermus thermophilus]